MANVKERRLRNSLIFLIFINARPTIILVIQSDFQGEKGAQVQAYAVSARTPPAPRSHQRDAGTYRPEGVYPNVQGSQEPEVDDAQRLIEVGTARQQPA